MVHHGVGSPSGSAKPRSLPPSHARSGLSVLMDLTHTNLHGNVHGGVIMRLVDLTAGVIAQRHSGGLAVTVAMDGMAFLQPVHTGDIVRTVGQVNWAGRTSMEIGIRVETERWNEVGVPVHVASAYLVFVAVDEHERQRSIPALEPTTPTEHRRMREASIRRAHRLAARAEIEAGREPIA